MAGPTVWALGDDRAGNRTQVLGVADALGRPFVVKDIAYGPMARLPNRLLGASLAGVTGATREALAPPWPEVLIAAGRRTAPVALAVKQASGGRTFIVQIMDPGAGRDTFDLIAIPGHDAPAERPNVLAIVGAPHRVTPASLARAREGWGPRLAELPEPRIALLVGGATKRRPFGPEAARGLGQAASELAAGAGGSLLVSTSRRTGKAAEDLLAALKVPHRAYRWGDPGENPYLGFLSVADAVIVTGDSVSMCCEACATGAPVYVFAPPGSVTEKHTRLHRDLFERGYARPLGAPLQAPAHPPLNAAEDIAAEIARRLDLR